MCQTLDAAGPAQRSPSLEEGGRCERGGGVAVPAAARRAAAKHGGRGSQQPRVCEPTHGAARAGGNNQRRRVAAGAGRGCGVLRGLGCKARGSVGQADPAQAPRAAHDDAQPCAGHVLHSQWRAPAATAPPLACCNGRGALLTKLDVPLLPPKTTSTPPMVTSRPAPFLRGPLSAKLYVPTPGATEPYCIDGFETHVHAQHGLETGMHTCWARACRPPLVYPIRQKPLPASAPWRLSRSLTRPTRCPRVARTAPARPAHSCLGPRCPCLAR
jgi:hypothetical protein